MTRAFRKELATAGISRLAILDATRSNLPRAASIGRDVFARWAALVEASIR